MRRPYISALGALCAAPLMLAGCSADASAHEQQTFDYDGESLTIEVPEADVQLVAGGGPEIALERWASGKAARSGNATWTLHGDVLALDIHCSGISFDCGARFQVAVPDDLAVVVRPGTGTTTVSGLRGGVQVDGDAGRIDLRDLSGSVGVKSAAGPIDGSNLSSPMVEVASDEGVVDLSFVSPPQSLRVSTGSGEITARVPPDSYDVIAESGAGETTSRVQDDPGAVRHIDLSSADGAITLLPAS